MIKYLQYFVVLILVKAIGNLYQLLILLIVYTKNNFLVVEQDSHLSGQISTRFFLSIKTKSFLLFDA